MSKEDKTDRLATAEEFETIKSEMRDIIFKTQIDLLQKTYQAQIFSDNEKSQIFMTLVSIILKPIVQAGEHGIHDILSVIDQLRRESDGEKPCLKIILN